MLPFVPSCDLSADDFYSEAIKHCRLDDAVTMTRFYKILLDERLAEYFYLISADNPSLKSCRQYYLDYVKRGSFNEVARLSAFNKYCVLKAFQQTMEARIEKDFDVLLRHKDSLIYVDEFGDRHETAWHNEIYQYCLNKVCDFTLKHLWFSMKDLDLDYLRKALVVDRKIGYFKDSSSVYDDITRFALLPFVKCLVDLYQEYSDMSLEKEENELQQEVEESEGMLDVMSGHEFEHYLSNKINNETSMHAEVTSGSGDQGADLIVRGKGFSAVIQAKHYAGKVGNKAIQEAFSARQYYGTGMAIVVANNGYTKSAWQLSEKTGVLAMSENSILTLLKTIHK